MNSILKIPSKTKTLGTRVSKRDNPNRHYKPSLVHFNAILLNKSSSKVYDYY